MRPSLHKTLTEKTMVRLFLSLSLFLTVIQTLLYSRYPGWLIADCPEYFTVAEQMGLIGYGKALSDHWAPLYSVYIFAIRSVFHFTLEKEMLVSILSYAPLLLLAFGAALFILSEWNKLFFPSSVETNRAPRLALTFFMASFSLYCFFSLMKVNLRMPDPLAFCFANLMLLAWCRSFRRSLSYRYRWAFFAGLCGGLGFLARTVLLPWSIAVGLCVFVMGFGNTIKRRLGVLGIFLIGVLIFAGPQIYILSINKGHLTIGSGKQVLGETYGYVWKEGQLKWPIAAAGGDVWIYPEEHKINIPQYYNPEKEFQDSTVPFSVKSLLVGAVRNLNILLFGFTNLRFDMAWVLVLAFVPFLVFGVKKDHLARHQEVNSLANQHAALFLILAGSIGIAGHLFSYAIGYYVILYLFPLLAGCSYLSLNSYKNDSVATGYAARLYWTVGFCFILITVLGTASLFRQANIGGLRHQMSALREQTDALKRIPYSGDGLRRMAVVGDPSGIYSLRMSGSQSYAQIRDPQVLQDPDRMERAVRALGQNDVKGILARVIDCNFSIGYPWKMIGKTGWCLLDLDSVNREA